MRIFRYLSREILGTLSGITGVLLLVFLSNQFVRYLTRAAAGKLPAGVILRLMMIQIPHLLGLLLPIGLFLSIIVAFGRLYAEGEMTVLRACGIGNRELIKFTMVLAVGVSLFVAASTLWLDPTIMSHKRELLKQMGTATQVATVIPGRFRSAQGGRRIYYVEKVSEDRNTISHVFMAEHPKGADKKPFAERAWRVMLAKNAHIEKDLKNKLEYLVFKNGYRYQGVPGQKNFQIDHFDKYAVLLKHYQPDLTPRHDMISTVELWRTQSIKPSSASELQWRLTMPLSAILLTLLAVPLSRVQPRQGKYARLLPAILLYLVYANLLILSHTWLDDGKISRYIGMWWAHGLLLMAALFMLLTQSSWWQRYQLRRAQNA